MFLPFLCGLRVEGQSFQLLASTVWISRSGERSTARRISETTLCRILTLMWSFAAINDS